MCFHPFIIFISCAADFRTLSRAEESVFLLAHLPSLHLSHYRPRAGRPTALVRNLLDLFARLAHACVTPQAYEAWALRNLASASAIVPTSAVNQGGSDAQIASIVSDSSLAADTPIDAVPPSAPAQTFVSAAVAEATAQLELARAYVAYSALKEREAVMNFDDLVTAATRLLRERPLVVRGFSLGGAAVLFKCSGTSKKKIKLLYF